MIAIGVGCRKNCSAEDVVALVRQALRAIDHSGEEAMLATVTGKESEDGLHRAAQDLNMRLTFLSIDLLKTAAPQAQTQSARAEALFGLPSVCETAALVGAGPQSRLILSRIKSSTVTCAIARADHGDMQP
ncbi:cobalamin biosynthesis protein [Methylovirgula sp. 4M-Z18]|uniref:cobalamin biosynthesis protein n=1 Tax=Methylovirgula sp. 4M-Z18 TaxID=2293567 RepID=UPI001314112C|nr:cobalamin biosynthesis protein [Methylovirgula sp. 4M-Z18]